MLEDRDPRQALYEALRTHEDRAKKHGKAYSRRGVALAVLDEHGIDLGKGGQRIGAWLNADPAARRVPRNADQVWALVQVWNSWAGRPAQTAEQKAADQRDWTHLVEDAQQVRTRARTTSELDGEGAAGQAGKWKGPLVAVPGLTGQEVARPELVNDLVTALTQNANHSVAMTTQVTGTTGGGGFGKTTLARLLVHHQDVRARYADGIVWRTLGADAGPGDVVGYLNELVQALTGMPATLTDPMLAAAQLRKVVAGRRILVVVDDVWFPSQLEPFLHLTQDQPTDQGRAEPSTVTVLVTTRRSTVLPVTSRIIKVDEMTGGEAEQLLLRGLPPVCPALVPRLLRLTSRWPLLLSLLNGQARIDVTAGADVNDVLTQLADHLDQYGPELDLTDDNDRRRAVTTTLQASLDRLSDNEQERFLELAVFGEDVEIPIAILERYWAATGGWRLPQIRNFAPRLLDLGLAAEYLTDQSRPRIRLHDVIHAWLRVRAEEQHPDGLAGLHAAFLDAHRSLVPTSPSSEAASWWRLPIDTTADAVADYLWAWTPTHLHQAHAVEELDALLAEPQWILRKLAISSPPALEADLELGHSPTAAALARVVRQDGHLLTPLEPTGSVTVTLASRISEDSDLAELHQALLASVEGLPHLVPVIPLPDLPHPALHRTLTGHAEDVKALAVAPDGSWLASAGSEGTVRIWDPATGQEHHTLTGHAGGVNVLAVAPDGSWLAAAGGGSCGGFGEGTVRIWDPTIGQEQHTLTRHAGGADVLAVAPDGSWLAAAGGFDGGAVRIWDPTIGQEQHTLTGDTGGVKVLAVAPDGSWLAAAGGQLGEGTVWIWDPTTGQLLKMLTGHTGGVKVLAVAPDGSCATPPPWIWGSACTALALRSSCSTRKPCTTPSPTHRS